MTIQEIVLTYLIFSVIATPIIVWEMYKNAKETTKKRSDFHYMAICQIETALSPIKYRLLALILLALIISSPITMLFIIYSAIKETWNGKSDLEKYFDEMDEVERARKQNEIEINLDDCLDLEPSEQKTVNDFFRPNISKINPEPKPDYSTVIDDDLIEFANFFSMHYKGMKFSDFYKGKECYHFSYVDALSKEAKANFGNIVSIGRKGDVVIVVLQKKGILELKPCKDFVYFSVIWGAVKCVSGDSMIADNVAILHCRELKMDMNKILHYFTQSLMNQQTVENKTRIKLMGEYVRRKNRYDIFETRLNNRRLPRHLRP